MIGLTNCKMTNCGQLVKTGYILIIYYINGLALTMMIYVTYNTLLSYRLNMILIYKIYK